VRRDWACKPKERVLVRMSDPSEELGSWVECKGVPVRLSWGLMRSLMEICTEKAAFTFSGVDWEAPFQGQFFNQEDQMAKSSASNECLVS